MGHGLKVTVFCSILLAYACCLQSCVDNDGPCTGEATVVLIRATPLITYYKDEPDVYFLRTHEGGVGDTIIFQTQLDTLFEGEDGSDIGCGWCWARFEKVTLSFINENEALDMRITFMPCSRYEASIEGRRYKSRYDGLQETSFGSDTLLFNDSLGFHYYARDSGLQLSVIR